jgi:hypothetical protein
MIDYYETEDNSIIIEEYSGGIMVSGGGARHIKHQLETINSAVCLGCPFYMWLISGITKEEFLNKEMIKGHICNIDNNNQITGKSLKRGRNYKEEYNDLEPQYKKLKSKLNAEYPEYCVWWKDCLVKGFQNPWQIMYSENYRDALRLMTLAGRTNDEDAMKLAKKYLAWHQLNMIDPIYIDLNKKMNSKDK